MIARFSSASTVSTAVVLALAAVLVAPHGAASAAEWPDPTEVVDGAEPGADDAVGESAHVPEVGAAEPSDDETTAPDPDETTAVTDEPAAPAADDASSVRAGTGEAPGTGPSVPEALVPGSHPSGEPLDADGVTTRSAVTLRTVRGEAYPGGVTGDMRLVYGGNEFWQSSVRFVAPTGTTIEDARSNGGEAVTFTVSDDRRTATSSVADWHSGNYTPFVYLRVDDGLVPGDVLADGVLQMLDGETVVGQADLVVEVIGHLQITAQPADVTVAEGGRGEISTTVTGFAPVTQWQVSADGGLTWEDVQGGTSTTLVLDPVTRDMDGRQYRVRVTNVAGSAWSDVVTLRVTFTIPSAEGSAAPGESVELRIYDPESVRAGVMTITAPTGTTIESVRHSSGVGPFVISEDRTTATSAHTGWGHSSLSAWVTLRVADDVVPGSVLGDGTAQIIEADVLVASGTLGVSVAGVIEVLEHPADQTVDVGTTAEFTTAVAGHGVSTQWQVSTDEGTTWFDVEGATGTTLTLGATTPEMTRSWYRAVHTNSAGQVLTDHAVLLVRTAPVFTVHPTPEVRAVLGGTASFRGWATDGVEATTLPLTWEYSADGESWTAYTHGTFPELGDQLVLLHFFPVLAEMDGVRFRAVAENHLGRAVSDASLLTVGADPVIETHPADVLTHVGHGATFSASTPAVSPYRTQQWQERTVGGEWTDIPGATDPTYSTGPTALEMDQREYRIVFTNQHGSTASESATLTVRPLLQATVVISPAARLVDQLR